MRLIDIDAFLEEFPELADKDIDHPCTLRDLLNEQPTVLTSYEYELAKMFLNRLAVRMETAILTGEDDETD